MNKEQKKFKEVIKKRRTRALRKIHPRPKFKWELVKEIKKHEEKNNTTTN